MASPDSRRCTRRRALAGLGSLGACAGAAALAFAAPAARAQAGAAMHIVVPYPAGGPLDTAARALAEAVRDTLGVVVIDNRPGAGGDIGADIVARAAPDGRMLVMGAVATHAINPWLYAKVPYDPLRDFTPITLVAQVPNVLVINAAVAARLRLRTLADLVRYGRAHPGQLKYGSAGNGSAGHLAGEMFKSEAHFDAVHIPYTGGPAAQLALLSGQVDYTSDNLASAAANIRSGKLLALAVTTAQRSTALPGLPTMAEAGAALGLKDFDIGTWFGLFGPARMAPALVARLNKAYVDALAQPAVRARLALLMAEPSPSTPAQFGAFVAHELHKYEGVVKASGARVD
ncbi:MAG: tripartite tricarboxylate transporter substrate binding protein [Burkholderiales bacterium]|nr:tripartite tricarboxylate transporter substrate binding protein [Burkholderiales bacterium]